MCLTIPGRIVRIAELGAEDRLAEVDFGVATRTANLVFTPDAGVGDYVIVQAGFAVRRLSGAEAEEALAYHREIAALTAQPPSPRDAPAAPAE
jgi:hydrogenase expression/formation protein HypC